MRCLVCSHFAQQPLSFNSPERGLRGKRRRLARLQKMDAASAPTGSTIEQLTTNEEKQQQGADGAERVDVALSGMGTTEGRLAEVTFGLNATTRALETAVASASSPLTSPYALLVLTSSCPPSLTSHYAHFSHHLHLPLLSLHPSISSAQLAHALHPTLTSLLVLAFHYVPSSAVLPQLHPFARVLRVAWLEAGGEGADWRGLRVERVARTAEREAREDAKRRKKEEAERAARPLSPKSIAAKVWKDNEQRRKEAEQAAAAHSLPPDAAAPASVSPPSPSVFTGADTVIIH